MSAPVLSVEASTLRKIGLRLTTFLSFVYVLAVVDRSNVSIAALAMNQDLHLSATAFGLGAGLFFAGYALFEVPSNLALHKVGASLWIGRIMITWGLIASAIGLTAGPMSFYILRFTLGAAEAGFLPGVVYYISLWYPAGYRAKPYAYFLSCSVLGYILVGPLSTWLMTASNGFMGMNGWRWLFVIEGLPCILLGLVTLVYLTNYPDKAKWLEPQEREWLVNTLEAERRSLPPVEHHSIISFLKDKRMWLMVGAYFWWNLGNLGLLFWLPTILKEATKVWSNQTVGFLYSIPFVCAFIGMHIMTWYVRKTGDRASVLILCSIVPFLALTAGAWISSSTLAYALICLSAFCIYALLPIFWTLPAEYLGGKTAAAGIAFISSWTGVGGLLGPWLVGVIKDASGGFSWAVEFVAVAFLLQCIFVVAMQIKKKTPIQGFQGQELAAEPQIH
jgi:MFS transporter, ACS family, tartrate transporter